MFGEAAWIVWIGCLDGMGRLTVWCGEDVWMVCGGSLEGMGRLTG